MMTAAAVALDGARVATLTRNGRTLRAEILEPSSARFSTHAATPPRAIENQNDGITALEAVLPANAGPTDLRIVVLFTPVGDKWPARPALQISSLNDWK
jgi:hypothetical protein